MKAGAPVFCQATSLEVASNRHRDDIEKSSWTTDQLFTPFEV